MGKGDKKSKRGKIVIGSTGVTRPRKKKKGTSGIKKTVEVVKEADSTLVAKTTVKKAENPEAAEAKAKSSKPKKKAESEDTATE
jgi:30S ribosomal protein S31